LKKVKSLRKKENLLPRDNKYRYYPYWGRERTTNIWSEQRKKTRVRNTGLGGFTHRKEKKKSGPTELNRPEDHDTVEPRPRKEKKT